MDDDSPEKVKDLLLPHLKNLHTLSDLARAYRLLGDAEWMIGHYQLAAAYYEKLFAIEPTFDNLLMLAYAYDAGGNLELAYQKYYLLANMEGEEVDGSRADIEMRLEYLEEVLTYRYKGTHPAPPPTFTPQPTP
jgi:tetratricopeptide (TPR) repeat protein